MIALHVRMCLRAALPSLDPQPACFSFTVQVCILTPLYISRYSLNSFHPLSLPFPSLLSSPNFLHILLALPPFPETYILNKVRDGCNTLLCLCLLFLFCRIFSPLLSLVFFSPCVSVTTFYKNTQTRTHTPPLHRNTLPPLQACLFPVAPELAPFLWS